MLIDTHAHLSDPAYYGDGEKELTTRQIIDDMAADGLEKIISVGYDLASSEGSRDIAEANANVYFAAGIHPSEADKGLGLGDVEDIFRLSLSKKCVAIGEIGLDYHYESTNRAAQKTLLERQLRVVKKANKPVIFHVRDAYADMQDIVRANLDLMPKRGIMHCFSGSYETAKIYVDMGFYISFSGSITFKNATKLTEIIPRLPKDRVFVETDCPYLTPSPYRGTLNKPAYVRYQAEKIAELWGVSVAEVEKITTENAKKCFEIIG